MRNQTGEEQAHIGHDAECLVRAAVGQLGHHRGVDVHTERLDVGGQAVPSADGVQSGRQHQRYTNAWDEVTHGVGGLDRVAVDVRERAVVAHGTAEHERHARPHALVHDATVDVA